MDQVKKRQVKKVLSWIAIAAMVAFLAAVPLLTETNVEADGPQASILSGTVMTGTIETALQGGGVLAGEDGTAATVPGGVMLEEFLVRNGDSVAAGDPIAVVDRLSVMNTIVRVQEKLDEIAADMETAAEAEASTEVVSPAGGRVKLVYAREGDSVRDVMLEYGTLAVLSLDGRMAVEFDTGAVVYVGDAVRVTLADGTAVEGRVESSLDGTVVVSVEDDDYPVGAAVTVATQDGAALGSGVLRIHNAWNAVAWSGTVEEVHGAAEETVDRGDVLFTLADTADGQEFDRLAREHRAYEEVLQTLFRLYEDGVISAPQAGVVSGADEDSVYLLENSTNEDLDPLEECTILTVIPQDTMTVIITVDERDIGKISLGQPAKVQVNALKEQVFDAVVTDIGTHGVNAGGSSKFSVELTLDRAEDMLAGMNATVSIRLGTAKQVLTIPVAALNETGSKTVVYTAYDQETGELLDPVAVVLGVSDGVNVQVLSGLDAGAVFYYAYYEASEWPAATS